MALVYSFGWWTTLFWVAVGIASCLLTCVVACLRERRRMTQMIESLAAMPISGLPPLPGLDRAPREDALEAIEGIGSEIARLLRADGIRTFDDLAQRGVARLRTLLHELGAERVGPADPASWCVQASLLAQGRFEAFAKLVQILKDGRVPLALICAGHARGETASRDVESLAASGVHSVQGLARCTDAPAIARAMSQAMGDVMSPAVVEDWIAHATRFERGDEKAYMDLIDPLIVERANAVAAPYPLTNDYQALLDSKTVEFSQAVVMEFDVATSRWREAAVLLLGRESNRACLGCRWLALLGVLALIGLIGLWIDGRRPLWCCCVLDPAASAPIEAPPKGKRIKVTMPRVLFPFGRPVLEPAGEFRVDEIVETLKARQLADGSKLVTLVVEGQADISGQFGRPQAFGGNKKLAQDRAAMVAGLFQYRLAGILPRDEIFSTAAPEFVVDPSSRHCVLTDGFAVNSRQRHCLAQDRNAVVTAWFDVPAAAVQIPPVQQAPTCHVAMCEHPAARYWKMIVAGSGAPCE